MNTKLIREFKTEFEWWLEDPENRSVMVKVSGEWDSSRDLIDSPFNWPCPDIVTDIVINDGYAEFRMAEVDGKSVEYKPRTVWVERMPKVPFGEHPSRYRIKPSWKWQDEISKESKPVLCRVWDDNYYSSGNPLIIHIVGYNESSSGPYTDIDGDEWGCAEPITIKDLHPFQREGYYSIDELRVLSKKYTGISDMFIDWLEKQ